MSALENLAAAEASLETVVDAVLADVQTLSAELAAANTGNDPAIQAVADKLTALAAKAQAVLPSPATPPAVPPAA